MQKCHIIPRFILKEFAINTKASKTKQKVMLLDTATLETKTALVSATFAIENFYSQETEKILAYQYEDKVAKIFRKIKEQAIDGKSSISLIKDDYWLLFRFFAVMRKRDNANIEQAKKLADEADKIIPVMYGRDLKPKQYKDMPIYEILGEKDFCDRYCNFDLMIAETTCDDPNVKNRISFYRPRIIYNKSDIHFVIHNSYETCNYQNVEHWIVENELPLSITEPISSELCIELRREDYHIDVSKEDFEIKIRTVDDKQRAEDYIRKYIVSNAEQIVVDDSNLNIVKAALKEASKLSAKIAEAENKRNDWIMDFTKQLVTPVNPLIGLNVSRNAPCPCGSGKKYKKCCIDK